MTLTLTDEATGFAFEFAPIEHPETMPVGGEQRLTIHELVGGSRVIDAMGRSLYDIEWSGLFSDGSTATDRSGYLENLMTTGAIQVLSWDAYRYRGVVRAYRANFQSFFRVHYQITFTPSESLSLPVTSSALSDIDSAMAGDLASANAYAASVNDPTLTTLMGTLSTASAAVATLAHAPASIINSIAQPVQAALSRVTTLATTLGGGLTSSTSFGGITPGSAASGASLSAQALLGGQVSALYGLRSVLGRMAVNVSAAAQGSASLTIAGGNLMQIASNQYGDPTAWTGIAKANGLLDPTVTGLVTLIIPSSPDQSGGVMGS